MRGLLLLCFALPLAGCMVGPDYEPPQAPQLEAWRQDFPTDDSIANVPWWELFQDPVLRELIEETLEGNRDLRVSVARIDEARALMGIARSDRYPRLDYGADGALRGSLGEGAPTSESASVFLAASWEVDLWGRIRRSNEATLQELLATEEAYRGLTISLVAEVASAYILLRDLDSRLSISEQTVELREQTVGVLQAKFDAGAISEVDLNQAQIQLYEAEVSVQVFVRAREQTENVLSLLLGHPPEDVGRGLELHEQLSVPDIPAGLPSELLQRRPDILAAEHRLHAQTERIGIAEAAKFPSFNLTADLGATLTDGSDGFFGLGANLFGPLFNAGLNQSRVDAEVARTEQLLAGYEQTILGAYREVSDAMVAVHTYQAEVESRSRQITAARNAAEISWIRYDGGRTSYLEYLDLQRSLFNSQLAGSETLQLALTSIVQLYRALGGGWIDDELGEATPQP